MIARRAHDPPRLVSKQSLTTASSYLPLDSAATLVVSPRGRCGALVSAGSDPSAVRTPHNVSQLGSEENFQHFLARASYFVLFSPIPRPYLVEYIFIQQLNYSQKFINYRIHSALLRHIFCMSLYLVIQKLFRVENHQRKGQSCELFSPILPITCPL